MHYKLLIIHLLHLFLILLILNQIIWRSLDRQILLLRRHIHRYTTKLLTNLFLMHLNLWIVWHLHHHYSREGILRLLVICICICIFIIIFLRFFGIRLRCIINFLIASLPFFCCFRLFLLVVHLWIHNLLIHNVA